MIISSLIAFLIDLPLGFNSLTYFRATSIRVIMLSFFRVFSISLGFVQQVLMYFWLTVISFPAFLVALFYFRFALVGSMIGITAFFASRL
jgi:hypothetical protein